MAIEKRYEWNRKRKFLESKGKLIWIRECEFNKMKNEICQLETPEMPLILQPLSSEKQLLIGYIFFINIRF